MGDWRTDLLYGRDKSRSRRSLLCSAWTRAVTSSRSGSGSRVADHHIRPDRRETATIRRGGSGKHPAAAGLRPCPPLELREYPNNPAALSSYPGCRGRAPAAAGCLRVPERQNAAVSLPNDRSRPKVTRERFSDPGETAARVHAEQILAEQRGVGKRVSIERQK